jgi:ABC-type antimicrobial peptide transport system permease subunit
VGADVDSNAVLRGALRLEDLGLDVRQATDHVTIDSAEFVLRPDVDRRIGELAAELAAPMIRVQSYLANAMHVADRTLPYSLVAALDTLPGAAWSSLTLTDGTPAATPGPGEILLNTWAAEDLAAAPGDELELTYYVVGPREDLREERTQLRVSGVVTFSGLGGDRSLTPDYPGVQEAEDMSAWDPPFPVDLARIRPQDERYWDDHGATPKAFVSLETGERLWSTRFGSTTSVRIAAPPGGDVPGTAAALERALLERLPPESFGYAFRAIKQNGLRASQGATDFAGLFVGFSFFLIVSAALLVGLLFGLGVEQRAREVGLLLAVGFPVARVRRRLLAEGGVLAVVGALAGLAAGVGYAWLMMAGLRSLWLPAVGSSRLYLHVEPLSLVLGGVIAVAVIVLSIMVAVRRLKRIPPPVLLAGSLETPARVHRRRIAPWLGATSLVLALGLIAFAAISGRLENPGLAFGSGTLLLVGGLAFFAVWCRRAGRGRALSGRRAVWAGMAARNSSWSPGRSILSVALVACACFVIVTVAANRHEFGDELRQKESGSGGFPLLAEADIPLHQDLDRQSDLFELGFSPVDAETLASCSVFPFRVLPGEDASCLNLYQPEKPRILGVPPELVERGGFTFAGHLELPAEARSPWDLLDVPIEDGVVAAIGDANSVQWILHLGLGRDLEMVDDLGKTIRLRLVGLLQTSIFQSELLISEEAFLAHFPGRTGYGYFLIDAPAAGEREITRVLESGLGPFGFDITTTAERLASFKEVEHTYLSTFQMLGGLGLLLGTLGLAVVLFRNVIERRGELATLRAFGFRRASLARMVLAENAFLLFVGIAIGGLSALAAVAPRLATIHVPWGSLVLTLVSVAAVGMLASVVAVAGALRIPLLPALKAER